MSDSEAKDPPAPPQEGETEKVKEETEKEKEETEKEKEAGKEDEKEQVGVTVRELVGLRRGHHSLTLSLN